jgi:hypothetical protein
METRKQYIEKLAAKLHEWDARIDDLRQKAETATGDMKLGYRQRLTELRDLREKGSVLLEEAHEATEKTWVEVKKRADKMLEAVQKTLRKAA